MRQHPTGYKDNPIWLAFELWADTHEVGDEPEDWQEWWDCFLAGVEVGMAEAG